MFLFGFFDYKASLSMLLIGKNCIVEWPARPAYIIRNLTINIK